MNSDPGMMAGFERSIRGIVTPFLAILLSILFESALSGCSKHTGEHSQKPLQVLRTLGNADDPSSPEFFGRIDDVALGPQNHIYLLDGTALEVREFTWSGEYVKTYGRGKGTGPGEFAWTRAVAVDRNGCVYITEAWQPSCSVFDPTGAFRSRVTFRGLPGAIAAADTDAIYLTESSYPRGNRVRRYTVDGVVVAEGCEPDAYTETVWNLGEWEFLCILNGTLFLAKPYPYELIAFDPRIVEIHRVAGEEGIVGEAPKAGDDGVYSAPAWVNGIVAGADGLLYVRLAESGKESKTILDVYDINLRFLARIATESFGIDWLRAFAVGPQHVLVGAATDPFPTVRWIDISSCLQTANRF